MKIENTVVLVTNIPNQYRIPLFNEIDIELKKEGKKLIVIFGAKGYRGRNSVIDMGACNFDYFILKSTRLKILKNDNKFFIYEGLINRIRALSPSKIIVGGFSVATLKIRLSWRLRKIPYYIWSGAVDHSKSSIWMLKARLRRILVSNSSGMLAYSNYALQYFKSLGAKNNISVIGNTVDVEFFKKQTYSLRNTVSLEKRVFQLTYIGYLTPRKSVDELLWVFKELLLSDENFSLNIIGSGESEADLKKLAKNLKIQDKVTFHGFIQKKDLPLYLAKSNLFLFQTSFDIWGLVLNETMAAGIPCLASIHAVATKELVIEGVTGFKADFSKHKEMANKIVLLSKNPQLLEAVAANAQKLITEQYSLKSCASKMIKAIDHEL